MKHETITILPHKCHAMKVDDIVLRRSVKNLLALEDKYKEFVDKIDGLELWRVVDTLKVLVNVEAEVDARGFINVTARSKKLDLNTILK